MWIQASTRLSENIVQVTTPVSSHLLVSGAKHLLIDASVDGVSSRLLEEIRSALGEGVALDYICLTHSHFDHVGGLPSLRKQFPDVQVLASALCDAALGDEEVRESLYQSNAEVALALGSGALESKAGWCSALRVDSVVRDGDTIPLGDGVEVKVLAVPGHTEDGLGFYVRPDCALAAAEAVGGYHGREKLTACFTGSYSKYLASLNKMSALDVRILSFPHAGTLSGALVPPYFVSQRAVSEQYHARIKERLDSGEVVEEVFSSLLPDWKFEGIAPEGPWVKALEQTLRQMIRVVADEA